MAFLKFPIDVTSYQKATSSCPTVGQLKLMGRRYLHCRRCWGRNVTTKKFCPECRKKLRDQQKQNTIDRERRARFSKLASLVAHARTADAADHAFQIAIANWYLAGQWSEHPQSDLIWAVKKFQKDIARWVADPNTPWSERFRFTMAIIKIGELRQKREIQELNGQPPKSLNDLKKVPKELLIQWIRKLLHAGYLKLNDLDPPPIIDQDNYYNWNSPG